MKKLVIAEKPSVGRDIARVLKCGKNGEGYLYNDEYIVSWAVGHLVTLWDPEEYDPNLKRWRKETLPILPDELKLKAIQSTKKQLNVLKKLADDKEVESLICATDSGREGELIFRYIYDIIKCKKPFERLWISSMTDKAITDGFAKLKAGAEYDKLYQSARCRSEADWLVGINASRAFTIRYNVLLSIGRVQTPTLAIIVARQQEIDSFESHDYWELEANLGTYTGLWFDEKNNNDTKIFEKKTADEIIARVKGKQGVVSLVEQEEKKTPPPLLYDLTELQRDCNKKFGMSAQETLNTAQDLYEKRKLITYPRTDSRYLSDDMIPQLTEIARKLQGINEYSQMADYVTSLQKLPITKRIVDNTKISDHHAIIPTNGRLRTDGLSDREAKVFDLVVRRFLSVFYPHYVYSTTKIVTDINSDTAVDKFVTRGTTVLAMGWKALERADKEKKGKKDTEVVLPDVKQGDTFDLKAIKANKKKTKPPQPYNEATLLSAMENAGRFVEDEALKEQLKDSGLGTPATRAAIIERLIQVGYVKRSGKALVPTEKAVKLISVCPPELRSAETTGKWEKGLSSIAKGKMEPERFMASIRRYVCFLVDNADKSQTNVQFPAERVGKGGKRTVSDKILGICPNCGGVVLENSRGYYCTNWRNGCKFTIWKDVLQSHGVEIDKDFVRTVLKDKKIEGVKLTMPDTREEAVGTVTLKNNMGALELTSLERKETKQ